MLDVALLRRALALYGPTTPGTMLAYDADPFAAAQGRAPLRRGFPIDRSKITYVSNRPKGPTMATDTDTGITSKLVSYLQDALTPEQMTDVRAILAGQDVQPAEGPPMAADARIRQVAAQARLREAQADRERMEKMFPDINRFR